jgi:hypothetical protein
MSTNPLKYLGGLILEIGAVVAALAFIPALGGVPAQFIMPASAQPQGLGPVSQHPAIPNQVFFNARSDRLLDSAARQGESVRTPWQNDFAPQPSVAEQRFVETMLDHNSQRVLDSAVRLWNQGDELLPPELRVRRGANAPREFAPASAPATIQSRSYYAPSNPQSSDDLPPKRLRDERY